MGYPDNLHTVPPPDTVCVVRIPCLGWKTLYPGRVAVVERALPEVIWVSTQIERAGIAYHQGCYTRITASKYHTRRVSHFCERDAIPGYLGGSVGKPILYQ